MICKDKSKKTVHYGKFNGLGGKVKACESILEGLYREIKEESGILITNPILLGVLLFPNFTRDSDWIVFVYVADVSSREFIESEEGSLVWVKDDEILKLPLWDGDREFVPLVLERKKFFGRFNYFESRLRDFKLLKV